jgi:DNA-binding transcriptional regulator YhcF (GntR family)
MSDFFEAIDDDVDVTDWLRRYVVGRLHVGALDAGGALPSIRRLAKEAGIDHRRIADAYRKLAAEGLVEIREGSGVYVTNVDRQDAVRAERGRWMKELMYQAWGRRIAPSALHRVIEAATTGPLRAGVIEGTRDHRVVLKHELETDFEIAVTDLTATPSDAAAEVDLVVGTTFESDAVASAAKRLGVPSVLVRVDPELASGVERRLKSGPVVAVVSDPRFGERVRSYMAAGPYASRLSIVLSGSVARLEDVEVPPGATLLATRAARRDLGAIEYHLLPYTRFIAPASARDLLGAMLLLRGVER